MPALSRGPVGTDGQLTQGIAWKRIAAEGVAIVVSILLAFAIDAAWDASRERAEERQALSGLREEFRENLDLLEINLRAHRSTLSAATTLLAISDGGPQPAPDSTAVLLRRVFIDAFSYNPSVGVLQGLIASGDLGLIRDPGLRNLLASWPGQLEENAEDEAWVFKDVQETYTPYLNDVLPTRAIWSGGADSHPRYSIVFGTDDFEELVAMRAYGAEILIDENEALRDLLGRILERIGGP